jgi:ribosomal protein L16 Arg81 hydroxylase
MDQEYMNVLAPVSHADFLSHYYEQSPLHIEREASDYFQSLLSITDIEALLSTGNQSFPGVQLVNAALDVPVSDYTDTDRNIIVHRLWGHYRAGATLVVSGAERRFSRLSDLCRAVSHDFSMRSQTNVYLSPGSHQGFRPHYDTHDVFVLQVAGSKLFRFYQSDVSLPFSEDTFPSDYEVDKTLQESILLTAGDTLYIPRGVVHDAVAQTDDPSLHITLGVFPVVVRDVLQEMVQVAAENHVDFRRAVDLQSPLSVETLQSLKQQLNAVFDQPLYQRACSRLFDEVAVAMPPAAHHQLSPVAKCSTVTINRAAILSAERNNTHLKLRVAGQVLEFNEPVATAVQQLIDRGTVHVNDLHGLDQEQCLALLDQLRNAGCILPELDS